MLLWNSNGQYYMHNAHGDVTGLTDAQCNVTKTYTYDAFGVEQNIDANDTNPFRYCGEHYDELTKNTYLRARYYRPSAGRFLQEDPAKDGGNWYAYCYSDPVNFVDPSGKIREGQYINGEWIENPDAWEFGYDSDTYKTLYHLGELWWGANQDERKQLENMAEEVRRLAREDTPVMYGQDKIMETLHENNEQAQEYMQLYNWDQENILPSPYLWFVDMTCSTWDYKMNPNWQVPYSYFNGNNMNESMPDGSKPKNWTSWIYFDGMLIGAGKVGNINLGYVGTKMGWTKEMLIIPMITDDKGDGPYIQYGIDMAKQGR